MQAVEPAGGCSHHPGADTRSQGSYITAPPAVPPTHKWSPSPTPGTLRSHQSPGPAPGAASRLGCSSPSASHRLTPGDPRSCRPGSSGNRGALGWGGMRCAHARSAPAAACSGGRMLGHQGRSRGCTGMAWQPHCGRLSGMACGPMQCVLQTVFSTHPSRSRL